MMRSNPFIQSRAREDLPKFSRGSPVQPAITGRVVRLTFEPLNLKQISVQTYHPSQCYSRCPAQAFEQQRKDNPAPSCCCWWCTRDESHPEWQWPAQSSPWQQHYSDVFAWFSASGAYLRERERWSVGLHFLLYDQGEKNELFMTNAC